MPFTTFPIPSAELSTVAADARTAIDAMQNTNAAVNAAIVTNPALTRQTIAVGNAVRVVCEGDSITAGAGLSAGQSWPEKLALESYFVGKSTFINVATSGHNLAALSNSYATEVFPQRPSANGNVRTILIVFVGSNDPNETPSTYITSLESYWTTAKNDGFEVWAVTVPPRTGTNNFKTLNDLIRKSSVPDRIIDCAMALKNPSDTAIFQDGLHPTALGASILASQFNAAAWSDARRFAYGAWGDMAQQNSDAVAITGGSATFTSACTVNSSSTTPLELKGANSISLTLTPNGGTITQFKHDAGGGIYGIAHYDGSAWNNNVLTFSQGSSMRAAFGGSPVSSAHLAVISTTRGFLPPKLTTTQKNAISSPTAGLMVYDTTLNKLCVYNGSAWETVTSA